MMNKGKVLVVDDDRLVLATVAHGLAQAGYQVIDADNGDDAILLARQHKPDLALLDIRMEGKTGFDVAEYLREYCQIPFMFLSAFADEATLQQVRALGALTYLTKPLDIQQIIPEVEAAFAKIAKSPPASNDPALATSAPPATIATPAQAPAEVVMWPAVVMVAVGIVMHRHSLSQQQALSRLLNQARQDPIALQAACERLVQAQEVLSDLGPLA
jgi:two-component system, response regulator PdtaR